MKLATLILTTALSMAFYSHDGNQSVANKRQSKGAMLLGAGAYDRIGPEEQPVRQQRCRTPHTIWYHDGKCYRIERLPHAG